MTIVKFPQLPYNPFLYFYTYYIILPIRKTASVEEKQKFEQCVDNIFKQEKKTKSDYKKDDKLNPWAICNATIYGLLKSQKRKKRSI